MKKSKKYLSNSVADTYKLGFELARTFSGGEVIAMYGDLGAGKTALTQGLAFGLGVKAMVNSPTFNIIKIYEIKGATIKEFAHIDAYRLSTENDLLDIGIEDYLGKSQTVTVIEWANIVEKLLPDHAIKIFFTNISLKQRQIIIKK